MKTEVVEVKGTVTKVLPNTMYKVQLNGIEKEILAYLCGKMNKKYIKPNLGDSVLVEMSPTDSEKGRISKRF
jgi:translation initiation factor IF-1